MRTSSSFRSWPVLILFGLVVVVGCTETENASAPIDGDLDARVSSLEARLDESEATIARLESTLSILGGHPMTVIEVVNTAPATGLAVCPNETVLVGGGCACGDTAQLVRSMPGHHGCSMNDESCVRAWLCECSSGAEVVRAICAEPAAN